MITLGIDIGSRNTKIVLYDSDLRSILFSAWRSTDVAPLDTVELLLQAAGGNDKYPELARIGCTGYGRKLFPRSTRILSEISCHAAGVRFFHPRVRTIIDIGGQDSKLITLDEQGKVQDFVMNDKCAAGTGRFLEMTAIRLECPLSGLAPLAAQADKELHISSTCVVFAESEIIGLIAQNEAPANIARAIHLSIAKRVLTQISSLAWQAPLTFTGGVALNSDLAACLAGQLNLEIAVPPDPEITGALGAAILVSL